MSTAWQNYTRIKEQAISHKGALNQSIMVRVGAASCGLAAGAKEVKEAFLQKIQHRTID